MEIKKIRITPPVLIPVLIIIIFIFLLYFYKGLFVAAMVNGQPIWRLTLLQELEKQAGKRALDSLITQTLILQEAKKQKITVTEEEMNQAVKQLEDNLAGQGQNLDQQLIAQGMTRDELKEQVRLQKIVEKIVGKDIEVTDKEVNEYLEKNKSFLQKDVKLEEASASAREQLRQQKISEKIDAWIESLRTSAQINYFVQF